MTALRNFEDTAQGVVATTTQVVVTETTKVIPRGNTVHSYEALPDAEWDWEALRDFVVDQIEQRSGAFPRDGLKESGIFKRFLSEWGVDAPAIARYAFETCDGRWAGAPVGVNRFCKGSDPFFAQPIVERIHAARQATC